MGYTIKQKIDICLKAEAFPNMTQADLALWAAEQYGSQKAPSQTTISRILSSKNDLIASKETDFQLVRRRKQSNPLLRRILTEWITQAIWENIPITTPIIQSTSNAIWNRLPKLEKDGNGIFNHKWCNHFLKRLNINLTGSPQDIASNPGQYKLNKVWKLDEKVELKQYLCDLIAQDNYSPQDIFVLDEFQLFYSLPLDQIFDVSSVDKGLKQSSSSTENSLTIMLGCNIDGSEKLSPLIVGKYDRFDVSKSSHSSLKTATISVSQHNLMNRLTEAYQLFYKSNTNKWITSSMFQNYLLTLDHKLGNRKILLLLDDSSSHRIINLKFENIKLCYLKNNTNHTSPYNSLYNGVKFDYLPMNFGIIEEFKILYRLQQYLEMINRQRLNSKAGNKSEEIREASPDIDLSNYKAVALQGMEVLSENDYHIPLIKVIEWIKRSWDSLTCEKIFLSWKKTHLLPLNKSWPSNDPAMVLKADSIIAPLISSTASYNANKSYDKLNEIMGYLNVVIPWEIDELLGLVNEMGKVTLSYVSIEEIIGSCLSESFRGDENSEKAVAENVLADDSWYGSNVDANGNDSGNSFTNSGTPGSLLNQAFATAAAGRQNNGAFGLYSDLNSQSPQAQSIQLNDASRLTSLIETVNKTQSISENLMSGPLMDNSQMVNVVASTKPSISSMSPEIQKYTGPILPSNTKLDDSGKALKHKIDTQEAWFGDKRRQPYFSSTTNNFPVLPSDLPNQVNDSITSSGTSSPYLSSMPPNTGSISKNIYLADNYKNNDMDSGSSISYNDGTLQRTVKPNDFQLINLLRAVLAVGQSSLKLSPSTISELNLTLKGLEDRVEQLGREDDSGQQLGGR
ncbi:hypothetical protein G9P44_003278 [Scheffersomyces stipitis]|nr:hypothetical protein G9P44_003278 [Scheffersomyces stipitis]